MRRRWIALLIVVVLAVVAVPVALAALGEEPSIYNKGDSPVPVGPPNPEVIANALLSPAPVVTCGSWATASSSFGTAVEGQYGEMRNCAFVDGYWLVTTLGKRLNDGSQTSGTIAIYSCQAGDITCLNGDADHPLSGWLFVALPYHGGATYVEHRAPDVIIVSNGGHQLQFNLATQEFMQDTIGDPKPLPTMARNP